MLDFYSTTNFRKSVMSDRVVNTDSGFVKWYDISDPTFNVAAYVRDHLESTRASLYRHGALVFRGLEPDVKRFAELCDLFGPVTSHSELSSPRTSVDKGVYTSTDHPSDQTIHMHNEQSYLSYWPMMASFLCVVPSKTGGSTPISDCRNFQDVIPDRIFKKLKEEGVIYVRNITSESTISWRQVFNVESPQALQEYCKVRNIRLSWLEEDAPRVESSLPAFRHHPETNDECFFNNIVVASPFSLERSTYESLLRVYGDLKNFPINVYYGDGTMISAGDIAVIMKAYEARTVSFQWQPGDIVIADNMLTAHSRQPYTGPRKVLVRVNNLFDTLGIRKNEII